MTQPDYEVYQEYVNAMFWLDRKPSDFHMENAIAAEKRWLAVAATLPEERIAFLKKHYG